MACSIRLPILKQASEMMARAREWADTQTGAGADYNNAFEREVLLAGFNGYAVDAPGGGRMVVLLDPGSACAPVRRTHRPRRPDRWHHALGTARLPRLSYKFDKFTLSHMGEGEGNQAYGWGFTLLATRKWLEWYRDNLSATVRLDGLKGMSVEGQKIARNLAKMAPGPALASEARAAMSHMSEADASILRKAITERGQLYKVELPEDTSMLHWDSAYKDQPEVVKEALRKMGVSTSSPTESGSSIYDRIAYGQGEQAASMALE